MLIRKKLYLHITNKTSHGNEENHNEPADIGRDTFITFLLDMDKGRKYNEISDEMLELSEEAQALCSMIRKLDK